jgi:hypothetical protein
MAVDSAHGHEVLSPAQWAFCEIGLRRGYASCSFVAVQDGDDREEVARSPQFRYRLGGSSLPEVPEAVSSLTVVKDELAGAGWKLIEEDREPWYALRFRRVTIPLQSRIGAYGTTPDPLLLAREAERLEAEWLEAERLEAERLEAERLEAERLEAERLEAERLAAERLEAERLEAERLEAERKEVTRLEGERAAAERLETKRVKAGKRKTKPVAVQRLESGLPAQALSAADVEGPDGQAENPLRNRIDSYSIADSYDRHVEIRALMREVISEPRAGGRFSRRRRRPG